MKRLVYSPIINVYVKTDTGVVDLSSYVTDCTVNRKVNQVSNTSITFRNPKVVRPEDGKEHMLFTEVPFTDVYGNQSLQPMFHPMDPIIVTLTRLRGKPIQVFTGYIDTSPYIQLFPGTCTIEASCTLKRLQYTFWDPGLPFVRNFLAANGWAMTEQGGLVNPGQESVPLKKYNQLGDSSIGGLLFAVLQEIGGWDSSTIYIEKLPDRIGELVSKLYQDFEDSDKAAAEEFFDLLKQMIGTGSQGGGSGIGASSGKSDFNFTGHGAFITGGASFYNPMLCPGYSHSGMDGGASAVSGVSLHCDTYGVAGANSLDSVVGGAYPRGTVLEIVGPGGSTFAPLIDNCPGCDGLGRVIDALPAVARDIGLTNSAGVVNVKVRPAGQIDLTKFNKLGGNAEALKTLGGKDKPKQSKPAGPVNNNKNNG